MGFTTRQVATAAGIAEGTLFRHFETKAALVSAVVNNLLDPVPFGERLAAIRHDDLEGHVLAILEELRAGIEGIGRLVAALGTAHHAPDDDCDAADRRRAHLLRMREVDAAIAAALAPFADRFRVPLPTVASHLRALAMSVSHPMVSTDEALSSEEVVSALLYGVASPPESAPLHPASQTAPLHKESL